MCPLRPEENFKINPSNGEIWCAFVTKFFTCSFSFFFLKRLYFFARNLDTVVHLKEGSLGSRGGGTSPPVEEN